MLKHYSFLNTVYKAIHILLNISGVRVIMLFMHCLVGASFVIENTAMARLASRQGGALVLEDLLEHVT
jgi:hypothetical protein